MTCQTRSTRPAVAALLSTCVSCFVIATLVGCSGGGSAKPGASGEIASVVTPSDAILGYVALPDLDKALDELEQVLSSFQPSLATRDGGLRGRMGTAFADPGLEQLDASKPLLLVVLRGESPMPIPIPPIAVALPVKTENSTYAPALAAQGMTTQYTDGLLIAAQSDIETTAPAVRELYAQLERADVAASGRAYIHVARALDERGEAVEGLVTNALQAVSVLSGVDEALAGFEGIVELEIGLLVAISKQLDEMQIDLSLTKDALDLGTVMTARPSTALAKLFAANSKMRAEISDLVAEKAAIRAMYDLSGDAFLEFLDHAYAEIKKDPQLASAVDTPLAKSLRDVMGVYDGNGSVAAGLGEEGAIHLEAVLDYSGEEATLLRNLESYTEALTSSLPEGQDAESFNGMQKNVREHAGSAVHRMSFRIPDVEDMPGSVALPTSAELAVVDGNVVWAAAPTKLDEMIDRIEAGRYGAGKPLRAESRFGKGRQFYIDYDFIALVDAILVTSGESTPAARETMASFKDAEPMMVAASFGTDRAEVLFTMPLGALRKIGDAASVESGR